MQFSLRSLLLSIFAASLLILLVLFWDGSSVVVGDGHRDLVLTIKLNDPSESYSISYATINSDQIEVAIESYPYSFEPTFSPVEGLKAEIGIPCTSRTSRLGRDLGYFEAYDTILVCVVDAGNQVEFFPLEIPKRENSSELKLEL